MKFQFEKDRKDGKLLIDTGELWLCEWRRQRFAQLGTVKNIYGETAKVSSLQGMSQFLDVEMKL
jgi:hypothetical protein